MDFTDHIVDYCADFEIESCGSRVEKMAQLQYLLPKSAKQKSPHPSLAIPEAKGSPE